MATYRSNVSFTEGIQSTATELKHIRPIDPESIWEDSPVAPSGEFKYGYSAVNRTPVLQAVNRTFAEVFVDYQLRAVYDSLVSPLRGSAHDKDKSFKLHLVLCSNNLLMREFTGDSGAFTDQTMILDTLMARPRE